MCTPLLPNGWQNRFLLSLHSFLQKSLHSGGLQLPSPLWDSRITSDPRGEEVLDWVISSPSMTLTHPPFYIAPLLTFPLPPLLFPYLALRRCFRTLILTTYQFIYSSLSLRSLIPTSVPLPSIFRKLAGMALTLTVPQQRNIGLFPLLLLSLPLWH